MLKKPGCRAPAYFFLLRPEIVVKLIAFPHMTTLVNGDSDRVAKWLRVKNKEARYSEAYNWGIWDGYEQFFDKNSGSFPTGLLPIIQKRCKRSKVKLDIDWRDEGSPIDPVTDDFLGDITLRDYQLDAVNACLSKVCGCVEAPTGSGKTAMIAAVSGATLLATGGPVLIFVPKVGLLTQTRDELSRFMGSDVNVGVVGDGQRQVKSDIVIATPQTLRFALPEKSEIRNKRLHVVRKNEPRLTNLVLRSKCLILDEAHHGSSKTWYELASMCPAQYRFAFSGTPIKDKKWEDHRLWGIVRDYAYRLPSSTLVDRNILAKPVVYFITDESIHDKDVVVRQDYNKAFRLGILQDDTYNDTIAYIVEYLVGIGKPPLVLSHRVAHLKVLAEAMQVRGVDYELIHGSHSSVRRNEVKSRYKNGENFALLASTIFDEGEDLPNISSIVLAGGGKTAVALKQRLGRGMRVKEGDNRLAVFDFVHGHCTMLARHSLSRLNTYDREKIEVVDVDSIYELSHYGI